MKSFYIRLIMTEPKDIQAIIDSLRNRQFELSAIKDHLLEIGYTPEQVAEALENLDKAKAWVAQKSVSPVQGFRGVLFIISGVVLVLSVLLFGRDSEYPVLNLLRAILGLIFLGYGIYVVTRPLKKNDKG
jgi:hypothetical protein